MNFNSLARSTDPYSRQLEKGFRSLRFDTSIEHEFRTHFIASQSRSAQICSTAGFATWTTVLFVDAIYFFIVNDVSKSNPLLFSFFAIRVAVWWIWLFTLVLLFRRKKKHSYRPLIGIAYVSCGIGASLCSLIATEMNFDIERSLEIIVIMAAFLPVGMLFYQALCLSAVISFFAISVSIYLGIVDCPTYGWQLNLGFLFAVPVGATGTYLREYSDREQFLYRNIFRHQAFQDPLTGIANRRLFEQHASIRMTTAKRDQINVVLAIIDVDYFKQFNDRLGHIKGDMALREIAQRIRKDIKRPSDLAARLGGEEFCILLFDIDADSAEQILDGICQSIEALNIAHPGHPLGKVTVSIGAAYNRTGDFKDLSVRADKALYKAKSMGRNIIFIDETNHPIPSIP